MRSGPPESDRAAAGPSPRAALYSTTRLRTTGLVFLAGKALSAPLSLIVLYVLASGLPEADFAMYVWLIAFGESFLGLSNLGLNWVAVNYAPHLHARASGRRLRNFLLALGGVRVALVSLLSLACWLAAPALAAWLGQEQWLGAFELYLAVLIAEAALLYGQDCVLAPLWKQGMVQSQVVLRQLAFLAGLALAGAGSARQLSIDAVVAALLAATLLTLAFALVQSGRVLHGLGATAAGPGSPLPDWRTMIRFAANNYAHEVVRLASGGRALTMLVAPLIGTSAVAVFGYARSLAGQLARLLPSQLFMGLLRPKLIAGYAVDGSFTSLNRRVVLVLKASNCVFAAVLAVLVGYGEPLLDYLSAGRYGRAHGVLLLLLLALAVTNAQNLLAVVVNTLGRADVLRRAAFGLLIVPPLAGALAWLGAGTYGLALAMLGGEALFVMLILRHLRRITGDLTFAAAGHARIAGACLAACATGLVLGHALPERLATELVGIAATLLVFLAALRMFRPFDPGERQAIERLLGRRLVLL